VCQVFRANPPAADDPRVSGTKTRVALAGWAPTAWRQPRSRLPRRQTNPIARGTASPLSSKGGRVAIQIEHLWNHEGVGKQISLVALLLMIWSGIEL